MRLRFILHSSLPLKIKSMRVVLIIIGIFSYSICCSGQSINIMEDPSITLLLEKQIELNRLKETVEGWRIQIYSTTDRSKLEAARGEFMNRYPDISIDWVHASPWYRLRAGAYANKLEATYALNQLKQYYREAYLAKDRFSPSELLK